MGRSDATPCLAPMATSPIFTATDGDPHLDATAYGSVVGALQHICIKRSDIHYCVNKLYQFIHLSLDKHWKTLKRVLRYSIMGCCSSHQRNSVLWVTPIPIGGVAWMIAVLLPIMCPPWRQSY
ncbi:hypothetical protein J1N35_030034 [Gossypium stocksii]|uniref:Uncharacterized protein n=1 Tax=Gossypium stocksii TaxID=47602 RepID=A0A9D3ZTS1_9ROSI|nr:hypothetical protein J1N35_030034 [Gossypium stocksii]